jgi:glucuronate isomerase
MIQSSGKAYSFARGITEREACALIDRMMEVHSFPRDRALDQVGITR